MKFKKETLLFLVPILISAIMHLRVFTLDVMGAHSWRQAQTQTVIYNFNTEDNSIFHPKRLDLTVGTTALLYEFPLYQWVIAQVNSATHYTVTNTRIATFIFFVAGLFGFFLLVKLFFSVKVALVTNALFCFSPLLYYYCINPLPDTLALTFSVWALYFFFKNLRSANFSHWLLFALLLSLATLVKLPYLLFGSCVFLHEFKQLRNKHYKRFIAEFFILAVCMFPAFLWYYYVIPTWSYNPVIQGMLQNQSSVGQLLYYLQGNVISFGPELLTNYASCLFLFTGVYLFYRNRKHLNPDYKYFLLIFVFFTLYFFYELNMIKDTHDYYLMPFVPLIFLVVAYGVRFFTSKGRVLLIAIFLAAAPVMAFVRIDHIWDPESPGFNTDYIGYNKQLKEVIPKNDTCIIDHDDSRFISLYFLKRKGYSLSQNEINPAVLKKYFLKGGKYLVTDNLSFPADQYSQFSFSEIFSNKLKVFKIELKQ